jgi:hypothetical protein
LFISAIGLGGAAWLLVEVIKMPISLFNGVSYAKVSLLAAICGIATTTTNVLLPNLFVSIQVVLTRKPEMLR